MLEPESSQIKYFQFVNIQDTEPTYLEQESLRHLRLSHWELHGDLVQCRAPLNIISI